jgi:hypothetical protein
VKVETLLNLTTAAFRQKFREICPEDRLADLTPDSFAHLVGIFKAAFSDCGTVALKAYLESCDEVRDVLTTDNGKVRFKMVCDKEYLTPFGWATVQRRLYQADVGGECVVPMDEKWGMRGETLTPMVREAVHFASGHNTPDEVESLLAKCALFNPSRTAMLHANSTLGGIWKEHGEAIVAAVREKEIVPAETIAMVVSLDGVNVLMREKGKKRGRKRQKPMENPSEETPTSYQNAMVGSVSLYRPPGKEEKGPQRISSHYVARMPQEGFAEFRTALDAEVSATAKKLPERCHKVLLLDGGRGLWSYVMSCPVFEGYLAVVDFYHATEYLAKAAEAAYGSATYESQGWFRKWKERLLTENGAAAKIIRAMSYLLKRLKVKGEKRTHLLSARRFFRNNLERMNYAWFHRRSLPVGSGVVEAACKSVVKARMCRSGMRWSKEGGETILALRTVIKSSRWDACWEEYQALRLAA